jgi:restriction system protein
MGIPDFQSFLRPVLEVLRDGKEHKFQDVHDSIAKKLALTTAQLEELLPSGKQTRFRNRIAWAISFLKAAELLERKGRSIIAITPLGTTELGIGPERIDIRYLMKFPKFREFRTGKGSGPEVSAKDESDSLDETPLEQIESAYDRIRKELSAEILDRVVKSPPVFFERLVVDLLLRMGYGGSRRDAGAAIGKTGDDGIDGVIKEDRLGLDLVAIQAKRWATGTVGRPDVQAFSGSLDGQGAKKGVFITTSKFSNEARDYVRRIGDKKIILIDGDQLAELMIDFGVGTVVQDTYEIRKIDLDYFEE